MVTAGGVGLLLLLGIDVFSTVFSSHGRGGLLNRRQNRAIWSVFRALGMRRDGSARDAWLALAGPVMIVATLCVWVLLLVLGFALIYYPRMESFLVSPGTLRAPALEVLYYSGYTAATLGFGDLVPDSEGLRLLAPIQAFGGFALLSTSVTYFLAVYREVVRKQALAASISSYFQPGVDDVVHSTRSHGSEALARWGELVSSTLSKVLIAHFQYPVLHYFRSSRRPYALPVQLGHLIHLRRLAGDPVSQGRLGDLTDHPSHRALQSAVEQYVREVDQLFVPRGDSSSAEPDSDDPVQRGHQRLLEYMLYG